EHTGYALVQLLKGIDPVWSLPDNWMSVTTDDQFATMPLTGWDVITVECAAPRIPPEALGFGGFAGPILACTPVDHHRPGDPGFGRPPEEFLAASSLGQVIARLAQADNLPESWEFGPDTSQWSGWPEDGSESDLEVPTPFWMDFEGQWIVDNDPGGKYIKYNEHIFTRSFPSHLVLAAAADYCHGAAYAGKCPGVDPEEFQKFRAKFQ